MKVETLFRRLHEGSLEGDGDNRVKGMTHDSRRVEPGNLFAAIPGESVHGVKFGIQKLDEEVNRIWGGQRGKQARPLCRGDHKPGQSR